MDESALNILIESSGNDIRQMINELQLHGRCNLSAMESKEMYFLQSDENYKNVKKCKRSANNVKSIRSRYQITK